MNKLAIFVEGQTEAQFIYKLLLEIFGEANISIQYEQKEIGKKFNIIRAHNDISETGYYVLIKDCMGDGSVKSTLLEDWERLKDSGYKKILGLRDVYSFKISEAPKLKESFNKDLPDSIPTKILLAIHETEAWFIAENSHFGRIDSRLTKEMIESELSINVNPSNVENIEHPAKVLNEIYGLVGKKYDKKRYTLPITIENLDYGELYLRLTKDISSLKELISELDQFIRPQLN